MPAKKKSVRRTRNGRSGSVRFSTYVFKVLKQVHPELAITSKAMKIMDDFMKDIFNRLTEEAAGLVKVCRKSTLTSQDFQTATRLILPGELAHHAVNEATKAVANFMGSRAADRDMLVPRMNRDVLTESRPTAREATEPEEDEVEASIEEGEAGDQIIRIELDTSPSQSGVCTDDEVDLSAECPDSNPLNLNPLNNKETDECETATEASEQEESPSRKRKEVMEHNDVSKKRKSDEFCLEPPALQIPPNITITECSTADKTDKIINAREEPTEDSRPIVIVQEIKAIEQSPEIVSSEISKSQKIVEETPIAQLVQPSTISKNDQETETLVDVLICQDTMDSGIHETEENSSRLQQTQIICEKKECNPSEGVEQSPQSVSCNDSGTSLGVFDGENSIVLDESSSVALESSKSSDLSPSPCISEQVSISRPDSETTLIYAKTLFSPEK